MKDCIKCGLVRIPKDWPRCGECQALRMKVETEHHIEAGSYRDKVQKRASALQTLAEMTGPHKPVETPKTQSKGRRRNKREPRTVVTTPVTTEQVGILQILERTRLSRARKSVAKAQHERVLTGLREWMAEED